jgi:hypothetical protein
MSAVREPLEGDSKEGFALQRGAHAEEVLPTGSVSLRTAVLHTLCD